VTEILAFVQELLRRFPETFGYFLLGVSWLIFLRREATQTPVLIDVLQRASDALSAVGATFQSMERHTTEALSAIKTLLSGHIADEEKMLSEVLERVRAVEEKLDAQANDSGSRT